MSLVSIVFAAADNVDVKAKSPSSNGRFSLSFCCFSNFLFRKCSNIPSLTSTPFPLTRSPSRSPLFTYSITAHSSSNLLTSRSCPTLSSRLLYCRTSLAYCRSIFLRPLFVCVAPSLHVGTIKCQLRIPEGVCNAASSSTAWPFSRLVCNSRNLRSLISSLTCRNRRPLRSRQAPKSRVVRAPACLLCPLRRVPNPPLPPSRSVWRGCIWRV